MAYNGMIDLRSDTVTRPTPEMRKAMAEAEVGDDVFSDDPTVNALQDHCAELLGKEAGLFVPTGSMGNLVCLGAQTRAGDEVICEAGAHFLHMEAGSMAANLGLMMRPLPGSDGVITADEVAPLIRPRSMHSPGTAVVAIENTHNSAGGRVFPIEEARAVSAAARDKGVAVHLDGARLFNAQAATGVSAREWADCADTVSFCFSKGLGAPVGSMVVSTSELIDEARAVRKRMGGGMRQAGVIAAAARVAIETGVERLADDHANARRLAEGLAGLNEAAVDISTVETNMVYLDLRVFGRTGAEVADAMFAEGVICLGMSDLMRLVTHRDVTGEDVDRALSSFAKVLA